MTFCLKFWQKLKLALEIASRGDFFCIKVLTSSHTSSTHNSPLGVFYFGILNKNMKSIIICGSISASEEILDIQDKLHKKGFDVEIPMGVMKYRDNNFTHVTKKEGAKDKKDNNLIKRYYELIKEYDIVLIVNQEKNGIPGYIGGNTFLEMGFAHVLEKTIYILNPLPDVTYRDELDAINHVVIDGQIDLIQ